MINFVIGTVHAIEAQSITVLAGAVGLNIVVAHSSQYKIGDAVQIPVYVHWNQEQGPQLFGFTKELEKTVFLLVTSCSGIGPKLAIAVLHDLGAEGFLTAVHDTCARTLSTVSGIGLKKAEHIIVQLKDKVAKLLDSGVRISSNTSEIHDVSQALASLHYSNKEVQHALNYIKNKEQYATMQFDQLLKAALSYLSKQS